MKEILKNKFNFCFFSLKAALILPEKELICTMSVHPFFPLKMALGEKSNLEQRVVGQSLRAAKGLRLADPPPRCSTLLPPCHPGSPETWSKVLIHHTL